MHKDGFLLINQIPSMGNQAGVTYPHPADLAPREFVANGQTDDIAVFKNGATVLPRV